MSLGYVCVPILPLKEKTNGLLRLTIIAKWHLHKTLLLMLCTCFLSVNHRRFMGRTIILFLLFLSRGCQKPKFRPPPARPRLGPSPNVFGTKGTRAQSCRPRYCRSKERLKLGFPRRERERERETGGNDSAQKRGSINGNGGQEVVSI